MEGPAIVVASLAFVFSVISLIGIGVTFVFFWKKIKALERRLSDISSDVFMDSYSNSNTKYSPHQKHNKLRKSVNLDVGRLSGYESASESVILDDNMIVMTDERRASLHGKAKLVHQVYQTAQSYFASDSKETRSEPGAEDIVIATREDIVATADPRKVSTTSARFTHSSGKSPSDCRKQIVTNKTISASGCEFDISGVKLSIPAGAIDKNTNLSLGLSWDQTKRPVLSKNQAILSPIVIINPSTIEFDKPVRLSFPHCAINALSDWTIRMVCSDSDEGQTIEWNPLTLDDYDEREVTESNMTITTSKLYSMYCVTGQSKADKIASKAMSVIAYASLPDTNTCEPDEVAVTAYCVNDYSKNALAYTSDSGAAISSNEMTPSFLPVYNEISDVVLKLKGKDNDVSLDSQNVDLTKLWHDEGSGAYFVCSSDVTDAVIQMYQESHANQIYTLNLYLKPKSSDECGGNGTA